MREKNVVRLMMLLVLGIAFLSGVMLYATPSDDQAARPSMDDRTHRGPRWQSCPQPSCMAPCVYPAEPEVLCRDVDGTVTETTYTCCCCGGSEGISFRPL